MNDPDKLPELSEVPTYPRSKSPKIILKAVFGVRPFALKLTLVPIEPDVGEKLVNLGTMVK
jgi:hypothetical protein